MYKIIIVDDEFMMRDGLSNLINWKEIGFQIEAVLKDGKDAIEWLSENVADVVLTDLKMTFGSGIDIARFVHENKIDTKVVIISGYSDFEAAQAALKYNVSSYLLKPVSVKNIRALFKEIYSELRKREDLFQEMEDDSRHYQKMSSFIEGQFITNLALGAIRDYEEVRRQMELIKWDEAILESPCCFFAIEYKDNSVSHKGIEYDTQEICLMLGGMISKAIYPAKMFWVRISNNDLTGVIAALKEGDNKSFLQEVLNNAKKEIGSIGIEFETVQMEMHDSLKSLSTVDLKKNAAKPDSRVMKELYERRQLMVSHILDNEHQMAQKLLESYIDIISSFSVNNVKNLMIDFFSAINNSIRSLAACGNNCFQTDYSQILGLKDVEAIKRWSISNFSEMTGKMSIDSTKSSNGIIYKAKKYIEQNCCDSISLNDVADHVFLSPVYLSKIFKEQTGMNFSDFLIECRIFKACDLLLNSKMKVYEICAEVGYTNLKYFYNLFRRKMGCTPSGYRHQS